MIKKLIGFIGAAVLLFGTMALMFNAVQFAYAKSDTEALNSIDNKITTCNTDAVTLTSSLQLETVIINTTGLASDDQMDTVILYLSTIDADTSNIDTGLDAALGYIQAYLNTIDGDTSNIDTGLSLSLGYIQSYLYNIKADTTNIDTGLDTSLGYIQLYLAAIASDVDKIDTGLNTALGYIQSPLVLLNSKVIACDTTNLDTGLDLALGYVQTILQGILDDTVNLDTSQSTALGYVQSLLTAINNKIIACNTGAVVISSGNVTVSATDLDIRDLTESDTVNVVISQTGTDNDVDANVSGTVTANIGTSGSLALDATLLAVNGRLTTIESKLSNITYTETSGYFTCHDTSIAYDYTLPNSCVAYEFKARQNYDFRMDATDADECETTYSTVLAGDRVGRTPGRDVFYSGTLHFKSPDYAGLVIEIRAAIKQ